MTTRNNPMNRVTEQYLEAGRGALERVRDMLGNSANWVESGKSPVQALTDKTLKLNRITHNSTARLVRVQAKFVEGTVEATAHRLQAAARAANVRELISSQLELMPATRDRIVTDARKTLDVFSDTRDDLASLVRETVDVLRTNGVVAEAAEAVEEATDSIGKTARKAKSTVRKTANKARSRKAAAKPARKTARTRKTTH